MPIGSDEYPRSVLPESNWRALYEANAILIDEIFEGLSALEAGTAFSELKFASYLPPRYLTRYNAGFLRRFLVCMTSVGLKMRLPGFHPPGCTAEELAISAMKDLAEALLEMRGEDDELDLWEDYALEDTDYMYLFDPKWDGIEDTKVGARAGMTNLHYSEWFAPFNRPRLIHPYLTSEEAENPWETDHDHYPPESEFDEPE